MNWPWNASDSLYSIPLPHLTAGMDWTLHFRFGRFFPPLVGGGLLLLLTAAIVWTTWQGSGRVSSSLRKRLCLLRGAALIVLIVMLLQTRLTIVSHGRPLLIVLLDTSASMALGDEYTRQEQHQLRRLVSNRANVPRLQLVQQALTTRGSAFIDKLLEDGEVEFYTFDGTVRRLLDAPLTPQRDESVVKAISSLSATGQRTALWQSLQDVLERHRGHPPAAVVVFSDGQSTEAFPDERLEQLRAAMRRAGTRLHMIAVGSARTPADVAIRDVRFEPVNFADSRIPVEVEIDAAHVTQRQPIVSQLLDENGKEIDVAKVMLPPNQSAATASLTIPGLPPGRHVFEVRLQPTPGENDLRNNSRLIRIQVRESRLRVLLIEQAPRWEFRHLKNSLERDHDLQLSTVLLDGDVGYIREDRTALLHPPRTLDELSEYDAVMIGDVAKSELAAGLVSALPDFVSRDGGGLILIPGPRCEWGRQMPAAWDDLLPVAWPPKESTQFSRTAWNVVPTAAARAIPLFTSRHDATANAHPTLPDIFAPTLSGRIKEGGEVLLTGRQVDAPRTTQPLLAAQRFGTGTVVLQLFDDSWRWRPLEQGELYRRYWSQVIRYAARQRMLDQLPPIELVTDRDEFDSTEPVVVRLQINDPQVQIDAPQLLVESEQTSTIVPLRPQPDGHGPFTASMTQLPAGIYSARLLDPDFAESMASAHWVIHPVDPELAYRPLDLDSLQRAVSPTGGNARPLSELRLLAHELPNRQQGPRTRARQIALWSRPELVLLICGLLIADWILRRRAGLI